MPVLESVKLIGRKLLEQAGMIENNYLCIMAFDKLAVWGGSNIKHPGAVNAQCSLTLLENSVRPEKREKGSDPWSIRNRGRCTSLLFSKVLSYYQGAKWKETINIQEFLYIRGTKRLFCLIMLICKLKPCLYLQSFYTAAVLNFV